MNYRYEVPIISPNLHRTEMIIQVVDVVKQLTQITDNIFKCIDERVTQNNAQIADLKERISKVNVKIEKLRGVHKATQVFSSSKYPYEHNARYVSVFANLEHLKEDKCKIQYESELKNDAAVDKLQFFHVKSPETQLSTLKTLGKIPQEIEYVNDMILYNTGINMYENYAMVNPLKMSKTLKLNELNKPTLRDPPPSIAQSSNQAMTHQQYAYTPFLGEVPALDVPLDLPDLPGIADDLRYDNDMDQVIAPSVITQLNVTREPLDLIKSEDETPLPAVAIENIQDMSNIASPSPPTPPPSSNFQETAAPPLVEETIQNLKEEAKEEIESNKETVLPKMVISDPRASLMEAIRNAGGKSKLKQTNAANMPEKKKEVPSGDLMADLYAKLSMRRKGISGVEQTSNQFIDSNSTLARISQMIPAPKLEDTNSLDLDDNDDDDDAWND